MNVQTVRILDVFVVAPFLFYASTKTDNKLVSLGLGLLGFATAIYNGYNYINQKKLKDEQPN